MNIEVKKLDGCKREMLITVPNTEPDKEYKKLLEDFKKSLQIPGFRRGKVPASVIEKRFGKELIQEVIEKSVPKALSDAIDKEKLRPAEQPTREEVSYELGQPLVIKTSFEIIPEINLEKYTDFDLKIETKDLKVGKKEVDTQLDMLRERVATFEPITEERPLAENDHAVINLRGESDAENAVPFKRDEISIKIVKPKEDGGFSKNLVGLKVGDNKEFSVKYPEDFDDPALAGNTYKYEVKVKEMRQQILPEIDDEFAKDIGQFENLDALKKEIKSQLEEESKQQKQKRIEEELLSKIIAENKKFDLPQVMVQKQLKGQENDLRRQMMGRGINPDHIGFDWDAFRKEELEKAEANVRKMLILDSIADKEKVTVKSKEIREEIDKIALSVGQDPKELRQQMLQDGRFEAIGSHMRDKKVIDWLTEKNTIKE